MSQTENQTNKTTNKKIITNTQKLTKLNVNSLIGDRAYWHKDLKKKKSQQPTGNKIGSVSSRTARRNLNLVFKFKFSILSIHQILNV